MVYLQTSIMCENCNYTIFLKNADCYDIADKVYNFIQICCKCNFKCCVNCSLKDTENNVYCDNCYFKYVSKGCVTSK